MMINNEQIVCVYNSGIPIRDTKTKNWLKKETPFLPQNALPKQRLWHVLHNTEQAPKCKMCDNDVRWETAASFENQQYNQYCCRQCSLSDPNRMQKKLATELIRYGKGRVSIVNKIKKTNQERYGADFAIQVDEFKDKHKQTCLTNHGVENYAQTDGFLAQREKTNQERYGTQHAAQSDACKEKTKQTLSDRYGGHQGLCHISAENQIKYDNKSWLYEQHINNKRTATDIAAELNITVTAVLNKIRAFDIPVHHHAVTQSILEKELCAFISTLNVDIITSDRSVLGSNKELDIYIPDKGIAVEFDGIYWHGELQGRGKQYHLNKTNKCIENNIQLLHVFESEWVGKQPIVQSMIATRLRVEMSVIYARQCQLVELDSTQSNIFLNDNHLQGGRNSSVNIGLEHDGELVSILTLSKPRYSKKCEYEIYRFCNKLNTRVVGGASKMFKYFVNNYNPTSVITYADRRFGEGYLYEKMGFSFTHNSLPNYKYFKQGQTSLHSRVKFQKHKLSNLLESFDPSLTEWENMVNNGYDRIWDCGNAVWEWHA